MPRSPRSESGALLARLALALTALSAAGSAQYGTIQREQKIASTSGGFAGVLGNDYRFGVSVAELGDFDGDGIRDLAVGAHRANIGGAERGALWLCTMNADGSVRTHTEISARAGGLLGPVEDHDRFAISICSLGDLDLDGTPDLAVGAYRDDDGGLDCGAVYVLFLKPDGTVKAEQKISALAGGLNVALRQEDSFGWAVEALGDLDGDGVTELAVGSTRDEGSDPDLTKDFGAVYVLFLNADGTVKAKSTIGVNSAVIGPALRPRDRFGADVVTLGDADGDGVVDVAVGAFGDEPTKYGKVFVLHLNSNGTVKSQQEIGFQTGGFTGLLGKGDRFGISLAADDFDGDGLSDLVVGAAGDDDGGAEAGALWVLLLDALGRARGFEKISADFGGFGGLLHPGDNFGISVATLGDLDRDGAVDLAVGAYQDDEGGFDRGASWILFRAGTGLPVADFLTSPNSGEAPLTLQFQDRSSGTITSWLWDFGDGASSSTASPQHLYVQPGVYDVRLTVGGSLGSDTLLRQRAVVVQPSVIPSADYAVLPATGPAPLSTVFSDLSSGSISAWSWDFGDGTGSSLRNVKHVYAEVGSYTVSLTVTGATGTSNKTVVDAVRTTELPPSADFVVDTSSGVRPLVVGFADRSTGTISAWSWDFGDGASSSASAPFHVFNVPGSFTVALTVSGPGGSNTLTVVDAVQVSESAPVAAFSAAPSSGAAPLAVQFADASLGVVTSWAWSFGDGATSSLQNPAHAYTTPGTYTVTLTAAGPAGSTARRRRR